MPGTSDGHDLYVRLVKNGVEDVCTCEIGHLKATLATPWVRSTSGHLYILEFSTGVMKVGRSFQPVARIATHTRSALVHGVEVRQSWTSVEHDGCLDTERQLIAFCQDIGEQIDKEYFRGVAFDAAREVAGRLAARGLDQTVQPDAKPSEFVPDPCPVHDEDDNEEMWERVDYTKGEYGPFVPTRFLCDLIHPWWTEGMGLVDTLDACPEYVQNRAYNQFPLQIEAHERIPQEAT